ncbi:MAG: hypothetical protein LUO82_00565 [Methanomicrobiales archaeon]|nr:hypothetical protein [Methanomicrobiales archaeon]
MPHRDIEQIKGTEAEALACIAQVRSEAEQMITRARKDRFYFSRRGNRLPRQNPSRFLRTDMP